MILYEYPFNERIRTWLRLERLFGRFAQLQPRTDAIDHHFALVTLFEILDVASRPDLKSEIMRDLERQKQQLNSYKGNPAIAEAALDRTLEDLHACFSQLAQMGGKIGHVLTEDDWLTAIRSRISIPGGTCEFDLPAYHAWQHLPYQNRQDALQRWINHLLPLGDGIRLLLMLLRSTGQSQKMTAQNGQFQQNLPQSRTFQLLRLHIDPETAVIPEISANRLIVTIRMMQQDDEGHLVPRAEHTDFQLTLCA
ncbi:MAG: cell division protein ZapD [Brachymonas sp.]